MDDIKSALSKWHNKLPPQQCSMKKKNRAWRIAHLQWADSKTFFNYNPVRNSVIHKKINYDLLNGKLHMEDVEAVLNPDQIKEKVSPQNIQHYAIINSKLNVLRGEEADRPFEYKVTVTNPNAISEIENTKRDLVLQSLQKMVEDSSMNEEDFQNKLQKVSDYFTYEWQDMREIRANALLNHYIKEYNMKLMFNKGFVDAMAIGEEIYQCDIRGGEPVIERVNPLKIRVFKSGYSDRIEDADIILMEDYWPIGKVIDVYKDYLKPKDIEYLELGYDSEGQGTTNEMGEEDERLGFINNHMLNDEDSNFYFDPLNSYDGAVDTLMPFDFVGNVRVLRMYWKSRRKIKKVKKYDPETGEETYTFYSENYVEDKDAGEEVKVYYINQAWEGTKIGEDIYVNMRPRIIQYNRLSDPSRCHFGIIGSIYNLNDNKPFSFVDMMKPYNYLYDVVHDRMNKIMARNWGKIITVDFAKVPTGWTMEKWLYYAKHMNLAVVDSFKAGNIGPAQGKLAGGLNNASSGVIDAELGNVILNYMQILAGIREEMSDVGGISRQREGQISNRETVGGVERATLQSSHITEWLFLTHDDVKKRALECFLETAKIALKGKKEKFNYILPDGAAKIIEIDGDEFAEADYGLVVDNSNWTLDLNQKIEGLAQAALQNQSITFSTMLKLYSSASLIEKQRYVEKSEQEMQERAAQQQQQQLQAQQEQAQMQAQMQQAQMEQQDMLNQRDNETKIIIANIQAQKSINDSAEENSQEFSEESKEKLKESMRQFDERLKLDRDRLNFDKTKAENQLSFEKEKAERDAELKLKALKMKPKTTSTKK